MTRDQAMSARDVLAASLWLIDREIAGAPLPHPSWETFRENDPETAMIYETQAGCHLAALSAAGLVVEQGWQPIKTAPKDQMVLVYAPSPDPTRWHTSVCDLSPIICAAKWHPEGGWCVCEIREVTHWRPLPAAPQEDQR